MFLVRDGRLQELDHLFRRHHVKLYNYFVMLTGDQTVSEDLAQEVFLRILRFRHTFKGSGAFTSWMFQIARNVGIDFYRRRKKVDPLDERFNNIKSLDPTPFEELSKNQQIDILRDAIRKLSRKHREVLFLARFQEMPLKEIAKITRCPVNTVKVRIHRAIKELSTIYAELAEVS
ncbi:RNA polymerase sigma factor [candidate division KSB1 bacterium]|nr:RNA polymerase sigma factor [candidate division KSB1 bacterium]RQW05008.1 MAG: RNA polymerase sigma factor [candidate division KSB1 bacterium]